MAVATATFEDLLDVSHALTEKKTKTTAFRLPPEIDISIKLEARSLGIYPSELLLRIVRQHFLETQGKQGLHLAHPVIVHTAEAHDLAVRYFADDGRFDVVEQRIITIPLVESLHALLGAA